MLFISLVTMLLAVRGVATEAANYDGHQVFRIATDGNVTSVLEMLAGLDYRQWSYGAEGHIDISMPLEGVEKLQELKTETKNLVLTQMHEDLGEDIRQEKNWSKYTGKKGSKSTLPPDSWFNSYHPYEDHRLFWQDLQSALPKNIEFISSGTSLEGRDMYGIRLHGASTATNKQAVIWHSNVHAREWITSMTVEYVLYRMVAAIKGSRDKKPDPKICALLDAYDFYIIAFANPDGFVYSQDVDRLWRKNRSPPPPDARDGDCFGVDINRNWPYKFEAGSLWQQSLSTNPCSETYHGEAPGDTPENLGLRNFVNGIASRQDVKLYIDWHSYGEYILTPYGYSCDRNAGNSREDLDLAGGVQKAIRSVHGTNFTYGPTCQTLYGFGGGSTDYVYDVAGAEFSWAFELRGGGNGSSSFVLPPRQIRGTGEEMWAGVRYLLLNM